MEGGDFVRPSRVPHRNPVDIALLMREWHHVCDDGND